MNGWSNPCQAFPFNLHPSLALRCCSLHKQPSKSTSPLCFKLCTGLSINQLRKRIEGDHQFFYLMYRKPWNVSQAKIEDAIIMSVTTYFQEMFSRSTQIWHHNLLNVNRNINNPSKLRLIFYFIVLMSIYRIFFVTSNRSMTLLSVGSMNTPRTWGRGK